LPAAGSTPGLGLLFVVRKMSNNPTPRFPASILGQNKQCVTSGDAPGALHDLPSCSELEGYCSVLEGKGWSGGPGEMWEIQAVLLALISPTVRDFIPVILSGSLTVLGDCAHPERLEKVFLPETSKRGKRHQAENMTMKRAAGGWQSRMGTWVGWGWLSGGMLHLWVLEICMGQHRGFLPLTLAGMLPGTMG